MKEFVKRWHFFKGLRATIRSGYQRAFPTPNSSWGVEFLGRQIHDGCSCLSTLPTGRFDLQIVLRRTALMLRNVSGVPLEPATEDALKSIAGEMGIGQSDLIQIVLREWLETNAYLPVQMIYDESETDGSA